MGGTLMVSCRQHARACVTSVHVEMEIYLAKKLLEVIIQ